VQTHRYYSKKSTRPTGPKYKKEYKDQMKLSPFLKQALIGLILGDQREFSMQSESKKTKSMGYFNS
jgi:hypothetical protein